MALDFEHDENLRAAMERFLGPACAEFGLDADAFVKTLHSISHVLSYRADERRYILYYSDYDLARKKNLCIFSAYMLPQFRNAGSVRRLLAEYDELAIGEGVDYIASWSEFANKYNRLLARLGWEPATYRRSM